MQGVGVLVALPPCAAFAWRQPALPDILTKKVLEGGLMLKALNRNVEDITNERVVLENLLRVIPTAYSSELNLQSRDKKPAKLNCPTYN